MFVSMVVSGLLTRCVCELSKEASGKCSGGSNMPYFTLRPEVAKQLVCLCEIFSGALWRTSGV